MNADRRTVVLNFDELLASLQRTVRRSAVMMGIGLNASIVRPYISHVLSDAGNVGISLIPEDVADDSKQHFADEFGKWVRANGIRELLEGFSIYLHQLYFTLYAIKWHVTGAPDSTLITPERFERRGIADQMGYLAELIEISEQDLKIVASLNQVRNCYAHRRGVVGDADLSGDRMIVKWIRLAMQIEEPNGNIIEENEIFDRVIADGGIMQVIFVEEHREFSLGQEVVLEGLDLKQISLNVLLMGESYYKLAVTAAELAGLIVSKAGPVEQTGDELSGSH